jgi:hypothetical protein
MNTLLLLVSLLCKPGERLFDLHEKLPQGQRYLDVLVSVEPLYARIYIYEAGLPDDFQQCCSDKRASVLRLPIVSGRFCIRQSQPQMNWKIRTISGGGIDL